jgi:hypothetical protein
MSAAASARKIFIYAEETVCVWASRVGRPDQVDGRPQRVVPDRLPMGATT